jgi:hypothetical protein
MSLIKQIYHIQVSLLSKQFVAILLLFFNIFSEYLKSLSEKASKKQVIVTFRQIKARYPA